SGPENCGVVVASMEIANAIPLGGAAYGASHWMGLMDVTLKVMVGGVFSPEVKRTAGSPISLIN
ncbi:hypothetical protein, partial [Paraburkholderia sp. SIMBA_030]|uniref:hypothetical protein n=1 Tax=Paraburkholderia sp. SIMBA_030 TaxID=3085773 RepID=UPI00397BC0AB